MKPRGYHQFCGLAKALDLVGERWTLLLVRDLLLGPRRYTDLLAGLPGLTTNLLAKRLKQMEAAGLIAKAKLPPPAASTVYELTPAGRDLEPALLALGKWGWRFLAKPLPEDRVDIAWAMVALKRRFVGGQGPWQIQLEPGGEVFQIDCRGDTVDIRHGTPWRVATRVSGEVKAFQKLFLGWRLPNDLLQKGHLERSGSNRDWQCFLKSFELNLTADE